MAKRRRFTPEFKAEVVLEVLSGATSQTLVGGFKEGRSISQSWFRGCPQISDDSTGSTYISCWKAYKEQGFQNITGELSFSE